MPAIQPYYRLHIFLEVAGLDIYKDPLSIAPHLYYSHRYHSFKSPTMPSKFYFQQYYTHHNSYKLRLALVISHSPEAKPVEDEKDTGPIIIVPKPPPNGIRDYGFLMWN